MRANNWLYHYYMVQSRLQYNLAYGGQPSTIAALYPQMMHMISPASFVAAAGGSFDGCSPGHSPNVNVSPSGSFGDQYTPNGTVPYDPYSAAFNAFPRYADKKLLEGTSLSESKLDRSYYYNNHHQRSPERSESSTPPPINLHYNAYESEEYQVLFDPLGRPTVTALVIIVFAHVVRPYVRPSVPTFQNKTNFKRKRCSLLARLWVWPSGSLMTPLLYKYFCNKSKVCTLLTTSQVAIRSRKGKYSDKK